MKKTILITGAGTGIGLDSAWALAARGHRVLATTFDGLQAQALKAQALARGVTLEVFKLDITSEKDRQQILSLELDVLINNAAVGESGSLAEVEVDRIRKVFEVNLFSTLALTQLALRGMIARQRGTVVFISSIAGRVPVPFLMPYSMSKFALSAAAAGLRSELAQLNCHVQVSVVEPGAIRTGFNQAMTHRKYEWMALGSYFAAHIERLKAEEARTFGLFEARSTRSIVAQIVKASEASRPKLRYVAPWIQGLGVRFARIMGV